MRKTRFCFIALVLSATFAAYANKPVPSITTFKFDFTKGSGFKVDFAEYPKGQESFYQLSFAPQAQLPAEIITEQPGLKISGNNHSDDLFMYAYKKVSGLKPHTLYQLQFSLEFATNAPQGSVGIGGAPGDSVYVKVGAVDHKPQRYLDAAQNYQVGIDKGNQAEDGREMRLAGTIGVDTENGLYRLKSLSYPPYKDMQGRAEDYLMTSDNQGCAWVIFGSDSGFEGPTALIYTSFTVSFKEVKAD